MEEFLCLLIPALLAVAVLRVMLLPLRWIWKLAIHSGCGFLCLWLLNTTAAYTGILIPINAVTVLLAGILGLPGVGVVLWLAIQA